MSTIILLRVTTPDSELAQTIARLLVEEHLAASVHVTGPIKTTYWWEDRIHEGSEYQCEARTNSDLTDRVVARVLELHPYEVPEILFTPLEPGTVAYENWLNQYAT